MHGTRGPWGGCAWSKMTMGRVIRWDKISMGKFSVHGESFREAKY